MNRWCHWCYNYLLHQAMCPCFRTIKTIEKFFMHERAHTLTRFFIAYFYHIFFPDIIIWLNFFWIIWRKIHKIIQTKKQQTNNIKNKSKCNFRIWWSCSMWNPPQFSIWIPEVIKRLQLLLGSLMTKSIKSCFTVKIWSEFNKPFWVNWSDIICILLTCQYEFVVNNPLRLSVEEWTWWVDVQHLTINARPVRSLCAISFCSMSEVSTNNCLICWNFWCCLKVS